eukprot:CAMPEP_0177295566 /NCGR_PEP_ID=MMETSP0368-20130122/1941_1 /TAXON_ID=447022 ORGANISM="Scrippsiella hangoei-like, Strain SHHI-4" /NCGR_SAMPLE_ID=MMETSP0368 /ASSEMBLY_ACC=CAM_ASM_000363 /LENGTH=170 /DNA_ID=CAMNT_0018753601 /DNA_START=266 /DNA_END=779 /DNA_ORIENTATION=-
MGMDDSQVAQTTVSYTALLKNSIENKCQPVAKLLRDLGFADGQIATVLSRFPQLLSYSSKRFVHRMRVMKSQGPLTEKVAQFIVRWPAFFGVSMETTTKPKVQHLRDLGFADGQILTVLFSFPQLLSYRSQRLLHRMRVLKSQGPLTERSLQIMVMTDAQFAARFERLAE